MTRLRVDILILLLGATCVLAADNSSTVVPTSTEKPMTTSTTTAASTSTATSSSSTSSSMAPVKSTTMAPMKSTTMAPMKSTTMPPGPTPTPTASPVPDPPQTFSIKNSDGDYCLKLNSSIELLVEYTNGTGNNDMKTVTIPMRNGMENNGASFCDKPTNGTSGENYTSVLVVDWTSNSGNSYSIQFLFTEDTKKGSNYWALDIMKVTLNTSSSDFPHFNNQSGVQHPYIFTEIFKNDFNRSYQCNSEMEYTLSALPGMTVTVRLQYFQAQVFSFKNSTTGEFDNARRCDKDLRGSKIVPIAVGAALAGLVIVVLIAYLIGRFKSRRQSSYEALS